MRGAHDDIIPPVVVDVEHGQRGSKVFTRLTTF
jgi:hypothetical protein